MAGGEYNNESVPGPCWPHALFVLRSHIPPAAPYRRRAQTWYILIVGNPGNLTVACCLLPVYYFIPRSFLGLRAHPGSSAAHGHEPLRAAPGALQRIRAGLHRPLFRSAALHKAANRGHPHAGGRNRTDRRTRGAASTLRRVVARTLSGNTRRVSGAHWRNAINFHRAEIRTIFPLWRYAGRKIARATG